MVTRADRYTQTQKQREIYSDFLDSFAVSPVNGSLAKVTNEASVRQSVKNLVLTNMGERLFQPYVGTNVRGSLFEPNDILTSVNLKSYIETTLKNNEPRAQRVQVTVEPTEDAHYLYINIVFYVINATDPTSVSIKLRRVR